MKAVQIDCYSGVSMMSERVLRVLLSEVSTLRLVCHKCRGVIEINIDDIKNVAVANCECRICGYAYENHGNDPIKQFVQAYKNIMRYKDDIEIEMVVPQTPIETL